MKRVLLGMLTPSSNTALEPLTSAMLAGLPEVTADFGRFRVTEISLKPQALGQFDERPILETARLLVDAGVDVIAWNGTSSGWPGFEADVALCRRIEQETGVRCCTSVLALNEVMEETTGTGPRSRAGHSRLRHREHGGMEGFAPVRRRYAAGAGLGQPVRKGNRMSFDLIVRNAHVATAADLFHCDIGIAGGRITALGERLPADAPTREIDAAGRYVTPGGVDAHCHLDQPMLPPMRSADGFETGTRSAACGGTTTVIPFAAQQKGQSVQAAVDDYHRRADGQASVDYAFHLIVSDPTPTVLHQELPALIEQGYTSFKLYMTYDDLKLDDRQLLELLEVARRHGAMAMIHAENTDAIAFLTERLLDAGQTAPRFHGMSRPSPVEREATHRAITLAELVDVPILIVHVSGAEAVEQIRWARGKGLNVQAETCPQYLFLTQDDLALDGFHGARCVCSPPPRDKANQQVIWDGLADGLFSIFSSDHAPFNYDGDDGGKRLGGKEPAFPYIPNGIPGLETRLPLLFSEGVLAGRISLQQFVALTATNPARLYGLYPRKGTLAVGSDADLVVWTSGTPHTIRNETLHHAVDYTPYEGRELQAWPAMTLLRGEVVWDGERFVGRAGAGRFLRCDRPEAARPRARQTSWRRWVGLEA